MSSPPTSSSSMSSPSEKPARELVVTKHLDHHAAPFASRFEHQLNFESMKTLVASMPVGGRSMPADGSQQVAPGGPDGLSHHSAPVSILFGKLPHKCYIENKTGHGVLVNFLVNPNAQTKSKADYGAANITAGPTSAGAGVTAPKFEWITNVRVTELLRVGPNSTYEQKNGLEISFQKETFGYIIYGLPIMNQPGDMTVYGLEMVQEQTIYTLTDNSFKEEYVRGVLPAEPIAFLKKDLA